MPGVHEREFIVTLGWPDDNLRVRFGTEDGRLVSFLLQYETVLNGEIAPITRYDTAHGVPHQDILDRRQRIVEKRWLYEVRLKDAFRRGDKDLRANCCRYKDTFLGADQ